MFLVVTAVFQIFEVEDLAINVATTAYYLLIIAVVLAIVEYCRDFIKTNKYKKQKEMLVLKDQGKIKKK